MSVGAQIRRPTVTTALPSPPVVDRVAVGVDEKVLLERVCGVLQPSYPETIHERPTRKLDRPARSLQSDFPHDVANAVVGPGGIAVGLGCGGRG